MSRALFVVGQFAVACGAVPQMVGKGMVPGLPEPVTVVSKGKVVEPRGAGTGHTPLKMHFAVANETFCGANSKRFTGDAAEVTCGNCQRKMSGTRFDRSVVETSQPAKRVKTHNPTDKRGKRKCRACHGPKDLGEFARDSKDWLGRKTICKNCDNARRRAQTAALKAAAGEAA